MPNRISNLARLFVLLVFVGVERERRFHVGLFLVTKEHFLVANQ